MEKQKYPRTIHFPWSLGITNDDKVAAHFFDGKRVVVTTKMDGENTTCARNYTHARSLDSAHHWTRDWLKQWWSTIRYDIPEKHRICGENMYAKHSIYYENLPSYFLGFSMWNEENVCLDWDSTLEWFELIGIHPVPVLYEGIYDETLIKSLWTPDEHNVKEGFVVRLYDAFAYQDFEKWVRKFVRPNHVTTDEHWKHGMITINKLAEPCPT